MNEALEASQDGTGMTLAEAIEGVRAQLTEAMTSGLGEHLRFDVGDVELEFTVDVRRDRDAKGGVQVWVANLGGGASTSRGHGNRLKVTLHPVDSATGRNPRVADHLDLMPPRRDPH